MFILKKILAAFSLPPGLFVSVLIGAGVYVLLRKKGKGLAILLLSLACLIWGLSLHPVADSMIRSLEKAVPSPASPQGDVVIVLYGTGQRLGPGMALQANLKVPLVLCGFNYLLRNSVEKARLLNNLEEAGIPKEMVIIDAESRDTHENIVSAKAICEERGLRRPLVVTSAFHGRRVRLACRKAGFQAEIVPVSFTVLGRAIGYTWRDALPDAEDLYNVSLAMNEYLGLVFYRLIY